MSNDNFTIQTDNLDAVSQEATQNSRPKTLKDKAIISEGVNFQARVIMKNSTPASPFSISISSSLVDFGILSPTDPIIRTIELGTNSLADYGYSVTVFENGNLTASSAAKTIIPDTTCDDGTCNAQFASEWSNALTYGFGYRCDNLAGNDCDSSFGALNSYKHFPNISSNDDPQVLMSGACSTDKKTRIAYKINVSGNQTKEIYSNTITYLGIPSF